MVDDIRRVKRPTAFWAAIVTVGTIALISGCGSSGVSQPAAPDKPTSAAAAPSAAASAAIAAPQTLLDISGSGIKESQTFTAAGGYDLTWSATDATGYSCAMSVLVYDATANSLSDVAVNSLVPAKTTQMDVSHLHVGGKLYLKINSNCTWTVKVIG